MNPFRGLEDFFGELCTSQACSAQMCQHPLSSKRESNDSYQRKSYQGSPASRTNFKRSETPPGFPSARTETMASKVEDNFKVFTYKTESGKMETFSLAVLPEDRTTDSKRTFRSTGGDESSESIEPSGMGTRSVSKDSTPLNSARSERSSGSVKVTLNKRLQDIKSWRNTVAADMARAQTKNFLTSDHNEDAFQKYQTPLLRGNSSKVLGIQGESSFRLR